MVTAPGGRLRRMSPTLLKTIQENKERIGLDAEHAVIKFEQDKLSNYPELLKRIEHVALSDVTAGYDIRSSTHKGVTIFIEVKAVSPDTLRFHWTSNEIVASRRLGTQYCLYLVPVVSGRPDIKSMKIINNPYLSIFSSKKWLCEPTEYEVTEVKPGP